MVLKIVGAAVSAFFPTQYAVHIAIAIVTILLLHAFSQGRTTNRERDLHGRTILVTGGFTPTGLTILQSLAQRGAHIIALSPRPIDSPEVTIIITLLRTTFSNEQIFAEQCDLESPSSIRSFCTRFLTGSDQRLDAVIFAHEYQHIGSAVFLSRKQPPSGEASKREAGSLATFLITTLLLPALFVAPVERDIRIITVVNPFYAAAAGPAFSIPFLSRTTSGTLQARPIFLQEGIRSLRTSIFTRHLQRILDALPNAQVPKTDDTTSTVPVVSSKVQKSNIVALSVSPGISRVDTIAPLLNADWTSPSGYSLKGIFIYLLLQPLLRILTKSPASSIQTVLHVLFLPTPFKVLSQAGAKSPAEATQKPAKGSPIDSSLTEMPEEILKPGALYAECAVVKLKVPAPKEPSGPEKAADKKEKGKAKAGPEEVLEIPDDGEFGGEVMGRLVWEAYEDALKAWEAANPPPPDPSPTATDVDVDEGVQGSESATSS
ncbi:putative oxidoreductase C19A8.06 [Hypsizygus marmoreus]|uniref:Oxidoreductase C19A8.06 n=1 Tax=Hypsizygus marmoreus TaxID=39966 RepID=A0A369JLI9_HYPMA|nr:putative oxidoreductase C19A8.06 [Hypsizygus marmoreus]